MDTRTIECNLDSTICSPRRHRSKLALFVHWPIFRHIMFSQSETLFSTNLASLFSIISTLDIEQDPYVKNLRSQLKKATYGSADSIKNSPESFRRKAHFRKKAFATFWGPSSSDVGPWAADWFICKVMDKAHQAANPYNTIMSNWRNSEKQYLLSILDRIVVSPISFEGWDIEDSSEKTNALINCLLMEKVEAESNNDSYNVIIFVQRRDTVIALAELLKHHRPRTYFVLDFLLALPKAITDIPWWTSHAIL